MPTLKTPLRVSFLPYSCRFVRLNVAAVVLGVTLASCSMVAPVVQCVPDSVYLGCKGPR